MSKQQSTLPPSVRLIIGGVLVGLCIVYIVVAMISNANSALAPKSTADVNAIQTSAFLSAWANVTQTALSSHSATTPTISTTNNSAPTMPALGSTRDHPYPTGVAVDIGDNILLTVGPVIRPANSYVEKYNMFNDTPEPGTRIYAGSIESTMY